MKLDPRRSALLVIDLQNDTVGPAGAFASSGAAEFAAVHGVVAKAAALAETFRAAGAPVIHVWHVDEPGHVDSTRNAELYRSIADADALVRGTWGVEAVVPPASGDLVVEKQRMSAFNSTTLDTKLRGLGVATVICCGAWTNWAVEHTCRDAADHGYETIVVTDATATISEEFQRAALDYALTTVAVRATAEEVRAALGS